LLLGGVAGDSNAIYIGDTAEAEIRATGPDYVIQAFADMWAWLRTAEPGPEMTLLSEIEDANTRQLPAPRVFH
jgi:hypothetical protein